MLNSLVVVFWAILASALSAEDTCSAGVARLYGETCGCGDECLDNSYCLYDTKGGLSCDCLPCQHFDYDLDMCVDGPAATTTTSTITTTTTTATTTPTTTTTTKPAVDCVDASSWTGCAGRATGNYMACHPQCQDGIYISCVHGTAYKRDCSLGWYMSSERGRYTAKMVYDPSLKICDRSSPYCPRPLDSQVSY